MRIGELSAAIGVGVDTIRYYEREGLLAPPARQANGYRAYGKSQLERLSFIRHCRALEIPLAEIRRLLVFAAQPTAECGDIDQHAGCEFGSECRCSRTADARQRTKRWH